MFISLLLVTVLLLCTVLTEGIRIHHDRLSAGYIAAMGADSVFSEYDKNLLEQYDLFFIPANYGTDDYTKAGLEQRMEYYMNKNLYPENITESIHSSLQLYDVRLKSAGFATDNSGYLFKKQAISYMENKLGLDILYKIMEQFGIDHNNKEKLYQDKAAEVSEKMVSMEEEKIKVDQEKAEEAKQAGKQSNPVDYVNQCQDKGILNIVVSNPETLSNKGIDISQYPSQRTSQKNNSKAHSVFDLVEEALFHEYIFEKFPCYTDKKEGMLNYQLEYILIGKEGDIDNLKGTVHRLLLLREGINFVYLLTDTQKQAEAQALATLLIGYTGIVPLIEATKYAILLAWAYGESLLDIQYLLNGSKIALVKNAGNWKLGLESLTNLETIRSENTEEEGITYKEYVRLLLYLEGSEDKTVRCMDIIEGNLTAQGKKCRMDWYAGYVEFEIDFISTPLFINIPYAQIKRRFADNAFTVVKMESYE